MTKHELITRLSIIKAVYDTDYDGERWHAMMEDLLLEYIDDEEVTKIYNSMPNY